MRVRRRRARTSRGTKQSTVHEVGQLTLCDTTDQMFTCQTSAQKGLRHHQPLCSRQAPHPHPSSKANCGPQNSGQEQGDKTAPGRWRRSGGAARWGGSGKSKLKKRQIVRFDSYAAYSMGLGFCQLEVYKDNFTR